MLADMVLTQVLITNLNFINLTYIAKFLKAFTFAISANLKISTLFVVSHFLSAKVSSEWRLNLGFRTQKKCFFSLNRGVPSREVSDTKNNYVGVFPGPKFVSLFE